jgi:hypothetical protein
MQKTNNWQRNVIIVFVTGAFLFSIWPWQSTKANFFDIPSYNPETRSYNHENLLQETQTPYDTYTDTQEKPKLKITNWFKQTKDKIASKLKKKPKPTPKTVVSSSCDNSTISWTVPDKTTDVSVSIYDSNGAFKKSYTITNYISILPKQRLVVTAKC